LGLGFTLGDFRNISTIFIFLLAVPQYHQNGVNILFLVVKPIEVTSGFVLKLMKKLVDGAAVEIFDI
jgi:hypothetical protein